jgi:hypothetical protein
MPTLENNYNWGSNLQNENPELTRQLAQSYSKTASAVNSKPSRYTTNGTQRPNVDPPASGEFNKNFEIGDIYVRTDTDSAWIMTSRTNATDAVWTIIT